jgi:hypothetical protein
MISLLSRWTWCLCSYRRRCCGCGVARTGYSNEGIDTVPRIMGTWILCSMSSIPMEDLDMYSYTLPSRAVANRSGYGGLFRQLDADSVIACRGQPKDYRRYVHAQCQSLCPECVGVVRKKDEAEWCLDCPSRPNHRPTYDRRAGREARRTGGILTASYFRKLCCLWLTMHS